jgi:hypothetical protein
MKTTCDRIQCRSTHTSGDTLIGASIRNSDGRDDLTGRAVHGKNRTANDTVTETKIGSCSIGFMSP